ncbi:MAG: 5-formyltetrahydrofolate cyclo-ligase [Desulfobacterales bacterium]|nr:5-formyltetrahydrofolate cyclo-ligase [Desulfobacterales bacterium]
MEENMETKSEIRSTIANRLAGLSDKELSERTLQIERRFFEFANFLEANIALLFISRLHEVPSENIVRNCLGSKKIIILPKFKADKFEVKLFKVDNFDSDLKSGPNGVLEPDPHRCKTASLDFIDIAIIPGIAFDEKGGRIGSGQGYYDRLIPKLPSTARKVALAFECQIINHVPMESHDRHVDIIISERRVIYKI